MRGSATTPVACDPQRDWDPKKISPVLFRQTAISRKREASRMSTERLDPIVFVTCGVGEAGLLWAREGRADWLYLGKQEESRARVEAALTPQRRRRLGTELHRVAAEARVPFLDFVAEVGALQTNPIAWWSTSFSWKNWGASDLFLLVCYLKVAEEACNKAIQTRAKLLLLIEDPWLFAQLQENLPVDSSLKFGLGKRLWLQEFRALLTGVGKRLAWLPDTIGRYVRQRGVWTGVAAQRPAKPAVGIYSYPMKRCLRPDREWHDPFLPGLDKFLQGLGYDVYRFSPPERGGFERELGNRSEYFRPLIVYATIRAVLRSWLAVWRPVWPSRALVSATPVDKLARREWCLELESTGICANHLYYECLISLLHAHAWECLVYPYENQPWEKLTAMGAAQLGVRTIGVQHNALSKFFMSYFYGRKDGGRVPLPDLILTSGEYPDSLLREGGTPPERLLMCGSLRYDHLTVGAKGSGSTDMPPAPRSEILVVLPIDVHMSGHLLSAVRTAARESKELHFHIKCHPTCRILPEQIGFSAVLAPDDIYEAFRKCGTVLFVGTNVGPEAVAVGRAAIRYRPELLLNVDPSEPHGDDIPTCSDFDVADKLMQMVQDDRSFRKGLSASTRQIFAPLDRDMLAEAFSVGSLAERTLSESVPS
jgi:hypothetical protein